MKFPGKIPDKLYDFLKWFVMLVMPLSATFYMTLAAVWGWPLSDQISKTITASTAFLGGILCISSVNYHKGGGNEKIAH